MSGETTERENPMLKQTIDTNQPYEKFIQFGPESLSDQELLAIIVRTGTRQNNAVSLSKQILELTGNGLLGLHHITLNELMSIDGIGQVKAVKIKCIAELSNRISKMRASKNIVFHAPETVADYYMEQLRHLEKEVLIVIFLDGKNQLISDKCISIGTINASLASTREIFKQALKENAVSILVLHNHPSGDASPSKEDIFLTKKLKEASLLIDIPLIDHIIIGDHNFTSLKQKGIF